MQNQTNFQFKLKHPFSAVISGPSNSGKTWLVRNLLTRQDRAFSETFENILILYDCWQSLYSELARIPNVKFYQGLPDKLDDQTLLPKERRNLLIMDDLMHAASESSEVERCFTQYTHHRNLSVLYLVQNLFVQGKSSRTISLNCSYMIIFKSPRDCSQVSILARQMYPKQTAFFMEAFGDATNKPFGYLLIDFKADTPSEFRLRTNILADRPVVYLPKPARSRRKN